MLTPFHSAWLTMPPPAGFSAHSNVTASVLRGCRRRSSYETSKGEPSAPPTDSFQLSVDVVGAGKWSRTKNREFGVSHSSSSERSKLLISGFRS